MEKKDYNLFLSLFLWMLIPSIYNVIRMGIISINQVDINILGQMEWFGIYYFFKHLYNICFTIFFVR